MMSPAGAIGWEFWHRHRWGFRAMGVYIVLLFGVKLVVVVRDAPVVFRSAESFALVVVVPITVSFVYLLAVFTYGLSGDLAARQSMYPGRMFTLPLSNAALVGWPMLYGAMAMVALWVLTRWLSVWPSDLSIPHVWPATLAASLVMWTQALVWMPYGLPGLRVVVSVFVLWAIDAIVILALALKAPEWAVVAITAPQIPVAYAVARVAVARARRGVVPDWWFPTRASQRSADGREQNAGYRERWSAARAQSWYEWRRNGRSLPVWVAIILPLELLLLWVAGTATSLLIIILLGALLAPVVVATFAAASVSKPGGIASDAYALAPFVAARPRTDSQLLAAKLRMTIRSTLMAWALVLLAIPIAVYWSGTWLTLLDWLRSVASTIGVSRAIVLLVVVVAGQMLSTWKQLVQSLCFGLTGNERLIKGSVFVSLILASLAGPLAIWIVDSERIGVVWSAMPLILAVLVCAKMLAAGWVAARLVREGTLNDRTLITGAVSWTIAVLGIYTLMAWLTDTPHIPRYFVMLVAILFVPLARLSAAPLAIARNRHR
ncbi:MAG TPA: hypothetical protein VGH98_19415 [Gemmatimonadaceae bacterium]|jgi:hypothetical protein